MSEIFIIAEVGINHNGDIDLAKKSIDAAKLAGADAVKFQTFKANEFVSDKSQMFTYKSQGKEVTESMLEMFKRMELSEDNWKEIISYCKKVGIAFSSTAQNPSDLDFLLSLTGLPFIKVGSDDLTNLELMKYYAKKNIPMIISAGMAYAYEIEDAVREIRASGNNDITVLHCVSQYPTPAHDVNLRKIPVIRDAFGVKVGFSDHTEGSAAAVGSVCLGAKVIEKHFTLDHNLPGPDHWFSSDVQELTQYIKDIRYVEKSLGISRLEPTVKEIEMRKIARRKIVAKADLEPGSKINYTNIEFKRTDKYGLQPKEIEFIKGRSISNFIETGRVITLEDLV
jgi:N,N'-diacetyllegionaminate synthase